MEFSLSLWTGRKEWQAMPNAPLMLTLPRPLERQGLVLLMESVLCQLQQQASCELKALHQPTLKKR